MAIINGTNGDDNPLPLIPSDEDDVINGLDGDDFIIGAGGSDTIYGGAGNDTIIDDVFGDPNDDYIDAGPGDDLIINNGGSDTFIGGDGDDTLLTDVSLLPADEYTLMFNSITGEHGRVEPSPFPNDTIEGIENFTVIGSWNTSITGGEEDNVFITDLGNDTISSNEGDDEIYSGGGNDVISPGRGNDIVDAGDGEDVIIDFGIPELDNVGGRGAPAGTGRVGGPGVPPGISPDNDVYTGGAGADVFVFEHAPGDDVITDFTPGEDQLDLVEIGISTLEGLLAVSVDTADGALIDLGLKGSILLEDILLSDLTVDDLIIV